MADDKQVDAVAEPVSEGSSEVTEQPAKKEVSALNVFIQGVALFSDGYNVQIIGYMQSVLAVL
jgi:hypothetical protein